MRYPDLISFSGIFNLTPTVSGDEPREFRSELLSLVWVLFWFSSYERSRVETREKLLRQENYHKLMAIRFYVLIWDIYRSARNPVLFSRCYC